MRRTVILVSVMIFVVAAAAAAYLGYRLFPSPTATITQANALSDKAEYGAAYEKLKAAYPRAIFNSDKTRLLHALAAAANNSHDYGASLKYYMQLNERQPNNYYTLVAMGDESVSLHQKHDAANYYRQALKLLTSGQQQPESVSSATDLKKLIDQLEVRG